MNSTIKAVILAAGKGSRLRDLVKDYPKCLLKIGNKSIIEFQIDALKSAGIKEDDIYVIGGYKFSYLKKYLESKYRINLIYNNKSKVWNNIYSFYLIKDLKDLKKSNFILLNSDLFFHPQIFNGLNSILKNDSNYLVIDDKKRLGKEEMKVIFKKGVIEKISKKMRPSRASGEYIGLAKFSYQKITQLFQAIEEFLHRGKTDLWYEDAMNEVAGSLQMGYISTNNLPWVEIDTPDDYRRALKLEVK